MLSFEPVLQVYLCKTEVSRFFFDFHCNISVFWLRQKPNSAIRSVLGKQEIELNPSVESYYSFAVQEP